MRGARIVVECLKREKVDTVFCYIGGAVIPIFDSLYKNGKGIKLIIPRHEQAGTHAADGYARSTGKPGVVIVTSGPGATNTITGIATAYMDSVPLVIITGQVPSKNIGTDAFQESDITGITMPVTKANFLVNSTAEIAETIKKAFFIANNGRKGPVLIDIPVDLQKNESEFFYTDKITIPNLRTGKTGLNEKIRDALKLLTKSKKPLILAGGGMISSESCGELNKFTKKSGIPAVNTLMGYGCSSGDDSLYLGGIGMHGSMYGNYALSNSDLLIALGTRFSDRILGDPGRFAMNAKIIQVDIDPAEIGKNLNVDLAVTCSVKTFLKELNKNEHFINPLEWKKEIYRIRDKNPLRFVPSGNIKPQDVIKKCAEIFDKNTIVVTDVGQNQMWVPQYFPIKRPRCHLTSGGLGTMGFALPAAIGAKIGNPDRDVLMFSGDGGFQMNIQELVTLKKYNIDLKMIILDNGYLGMVRQWQQLMCDSRYSATDMGDNPDFVRISEAFGIKAARVTNANECGNKILELKNSRESMLLHITIEREENVLPMVPPGRPLNEAISKL